MHFAEPPTACVLDRDEDKKQTEPGPRPRGPAPDEGGGRPKRPREWQAYNTDVLVALLDA